MVGKLRSRFLTLVSIKEHEIGRRIKAIEIAEATGVSPATVGRWLKNEVNKFEGPVLEAFCSYFDCDVGDLLYIEPEKNKEG